MKRRLLLASRGDWLLFHVSQMKKNTVILEYSWMYFKNKKKKIKIPRQMLSRD